MKQKSIKHLDQLLPGVSALLHQGEFWDCLTAKANVIFFEQTQL